MKRDDRTAPSADEGHRDEPKGPLRLVELSSQRVVAHELPARGAVTIGRAADATISLDDPQVSRLHATVTLGDDVTLTDAGSSNGTRLRDARLGSGERVTLRVGDVVEVGATMLVLQASARGRGEGATSGAARAPDGMRAQVVVDDAAMQRLRRLVERVAPGVISVLLLGETGVGKEVFAEMIHRQSRRAAGPFVRLNCAALSESLLESELFGHERGAFTGASQGKPGLLESADGGTVFLDEVGELPASVQVKLLRVIEARQVTRVGALQPRSLDVRFVSATHRDLEADIDRGRFRQDLYFRLNGISLTIPPLRERPTEIEMLARVFLAEACERSGVAPQPALSADAIERLRAHPWPGNLRELRNVMERAALLCADGVITGEHLPLTARVTLPPAAAATAGAATVTASAAAGAAAAESPLRAQLAAMERQRILDALERCGGNQTRAAEMLQMSRRTLVARLAEYGVQRPRK